jgi:hypothetical protein
LPILAQKLSRIGDWGGSNLDANSLQSGSVLDAIQQAPWKDRKTAYLEHLQGASDEVLLVSCADKLHNARAIVSDLINEGPSVFERFSSTPEQTLWYYRQLATIFNNRKAPPAKALESAVSQMEALSQSAW